MPIYEYVCDDCGAHYERIVMSQKQSSPVRSVRARNTRFSSQCSLRLPMAAKRAADLPQVPHRAQAVHAVAAVAAAID